MFGPESGQQRLYDQAIAHIVEEVLDGFNCTIFAYGQTGTGKTYTMEGGDRRSDTGAPLSEVNMRAHCLALARLRGQCGLIGEQVLRRLPAQRAAGSWHADGTECAEVSVWLQVAGVIPRAIAQIFSKLDTDDSEYTVKCSFLELYNEETTDLLAVGDPAKAAQQKLRIMEDRNGASWQQLHQLPASQAISAKTLRPHQHWAASGSPP